MVHTVNLSYEEAEVGLSGAFHTTARAREPGVGRQGGRARARGGVALANKRT